MASELVDFIYIHLFEKQRSRTFKDITESVKQIGPAFLCLCACALKWGLQQYADSGIRKKVQSFDPNIVLRKYVATFRVL
jgi:hypothetical protein